MLDDLHALILGILSADIRFVVGFLRVVSSLYPIAADFYADGVRTSFEQYGDPSYAISFFLIPAYLLTVAICELPPYFVFFSYSHFRRPTVLIQKGI